MLFKKKPLPKKPTTKEKKVNEKTKTATAEQEPPDPFKRIQETQAAAQEPTRKVDRGDVKPSVAKPESFQEKKPEQMTGAEQEAMMAGGGVLPKEQAEKEKATVGPTGPVMPPPTPPTGAPQK